MPEISVLMPAYNGEKFISEAINSILNQTFIDWELIIVNDGSIDNTKKIIDSFQDNRIKYFENEKNEGLTYTRNKLLSLAKSKYIAFLDCDDIALPQRLEKQLKIFQQDQNLAILSGSMKTINEDGKIDNNSMKFSFSKVELIAQLLFHNPISTSTVMINRQNAQDLFFRDEYPPCEDFDLWTRILHQNSGIVLEDYLSIYRLHPNNISKIKFIEANFNRNKVIENQLDFYFGKLLSETDKITHMLLVDMSVNCSNDDIIKINRYIESILIINNERKIFEYEILNQVLFERVLKRFLRLENNSIKNFKEYKKIKKVLQPKMHSILYIKELVIMSYSLFRK